MDENLKYAREYEKKAVELSSRGDSAEAFKAYAFASDLYEEVGEYSKAAKLKRELAKIYEALGNESGKRTMLSAANWLEQQLH